MKTQKIVLALALAAVTPAVVSAQEYVGGPGSKMSYIADNALARIRENNKNKNQQEPVQKKQHDTTSIYTSVPAYYPYGGREGHMTVQDDVHKKNNNKHHKDTTKKKPSASDISNKTNSNYNPYIGREGHMMAVGNAVRDARRNSTPVPTHVKDIDTVSTNHQVTLDGKTAEKSAKKTNSGFRQLLSEVNQAIAQEARYSK